jgi:threonine aldolase
MAPGITEFVVEGERFEVKKAAAQKLDALKVLNNCHKNGGRDGEQDQMINGRSDTSAAVSTDNITDDDSTPVFTMPSIHKLREAQRRVEHDFRSDTVTVPTVHMMQAMIESSFQDDMYDTTGDESVNRLQQRLAELTGKEAAMWALSGTMGNQICLRTHLTQPPHTVLLDYRAHVHCWETGAMPVMSQASVSQVHPKNGLHLTVGDVKKHIIADGNSMSFSFSSDYVVTIN